MKVLQEMKLLQINGKKSDFLLIKFHTYQQTITGDLLDLYDHVDQILKYFTEYESQNSLPNEATFETMKIIGWKFGITFSWNFIVTKAELFQN
jgi:hypothetical protein